MNALLALPIEARLAVAFAVGVCAGAVVNWAAYALAYQPRWISPWSPQPRGDDGAPLTVRRWLDRVPILGWWFLRREANWHGCGFWIRPLLVEIAIGCACCWLFWWEVEQWGLFGWMLPAGMVNALLASPTTVLIGFSPPYTLHSTWLAHAILLAFMMAASLIDVDERTIPDAITVPGTLVGLAIASAIPWSRLPADLSSSWAGVGFPFVMEFEFLTAVSPMKVWPDVLGPAPQVAGLTIGLACYAAWVILLLPRPWYTRHGLRRALSVWIARAWRGLIGGWGLWRPMLALLLGGSAAIVGVWRYGGPHWIGLVSALIGLAVGGGLVWVVRQIASGALGKEAMGLGDVTLLAMVGTYVGWQPCLIIFFLAPLFALVFGVIRLVLRGQNDLFYGPFLCLATAVVIVRWGDVWERFQPAFSFGWLVPAAMGVVLAAMALMLAGMRRLRS